MSVYEKAVNSKSRARVIPVRVWPYGKTAEPSKIIHSSYFKHRKKLLARFMSDSNRSSAHRQYSSYKGVSKFYAWFVEDVFYGAIKAVTTNGDYVQKEVGKSKRRQFLEIMWYSVMAPSLPENYYKFKWYGSEGRRFRDYVHRYETKNVVYKLISVGRGGEVQSLSDKLKFSEYCLENMIPAVSILAVVNKKKVVFLGVDGPELINQDVFIKPLNGKGGKEAFRATFLLNELGERCFKFKGEVYKEEDFYLKLKLRASKKRVTYIVQPRIRSHKKLLAMSGEVASTLRLITVINEVGEPEIVYSIFRVPGDLNGDVDNTHAGGLAASVDINTGLIGNLVDYGISGSNVEASHHPKNGVAVAGEIIPMFEDTKSLVVDAHKKFNGRVMIAWDVCITDEGPLIIEANGQPCSDGPQRLLNKPMSDLRFGELLAYHLKNNIPYEK